MRLSYYDLVRIIKDGVIDALPENINGTSIDVRLSDKIMVEENFYGIVQTVNLPMKDTPIMREIVIEKEYILAPGEFILASTIEVFNLPLDIDANFYLKSSLARCGLNNLLAGHCDPGWTGSQLTLELYNCLQYHKLRLVPGMKIGQVVFGKVSPVPSEHSYTQKGQYNNDKGPQSKGLR